MDLSRQLGRNLGRSWLVFLTLIPLASPAQQEKSFSFTTDELIEDSFSWLARPDDRDVVHVYKLSCQTCIGEIQTAFKQDPQYQGLIYFRTLQKSDRPIAQALLATTLSHKDEPKRVDTFRELLNIYANASDQFLRNPEEWKSLVGSFWNYDNYALEDFEPWADALNWMDRQNRILALLNKRSFPAKIVLYPHVAIPEVNQSSYRDRFLFTALALPWLKYPTILPKNVGETGAPLPNLPMVFIQPVGQYDVLKWRTFARTAQTGAFWNFFGRRRRDAAPTITGIPGAVSGFADRPGSSNCFCRCHKDHRWRQCAGTPQKHSGNLASRKI